jgi:hypothetical protein
MSEAYTSDPRFERFLWGLKEGMTVDQSRRQAGLNWNSLYKLKNRSLLFREDWEQALLDGGRRYPVSRDPRFDLFLDSLRAGRTVAQSMTDAGLYWRRLYQRKHADPGFQDAWDDAMVAGGRQIGDSEDPRFEVFLRELKERGSFTAALEAAELDCRSLYTYRLRNRRFKTACEKIMQESGVRPEFDDPRYEVFLSGLRQGKTINGAMRESALNWKTLYAFKSGSEEFQAAWDQAASEGGRVYAKFRPITPEAVSTFLECIRNGDTVKLAASKSGITLASIYKKSSRDPKLAEAWKEAYRAARAKTHPFQEGEAFLAKIEEGCTVGQAAKFAGRDITTFYRQKKKDPEFSEKWAAAFKIQKRLKLKQKLERAAEMALLGKGFAPARFESTAASLPRAGDKPPVAEPQAEARPSGGHAPAADKPRCGAHAGQHKYTHSE